MRTVKINLNGKETEALVVEHIYKVKRKRRIRGKIYEWEERYLHLFLPKTFTARRVLIVKADDINV